MHSPFSGHEIRANPLGRMKGIVPRARRCANETVDASHLVFGTTSNNIVGESPGVVIDEGARGMPTIVFMKNWVAFAYPKSFAVDAH